MLQEAELSTTLIQRTPRRTGNDSKIMLLTAKMPVWANSLNRVSSRGGCRQTRIADSRSRLDTDCCHYRERPRLGRIYG